MLLTTILRSLFVVLMICLLPVTSTAAITGSAHDFSLTGWSGGEICIVCHTPHNANGDVTGAPLWNHELTTASYTLYSSPTMDVATEQPRTMSKLCLSCHDGTVAVDSFGGATGTTMIAGSANLGTDLSNDHPVSVPWRHNGAMVSPGNCATCHTHPGQGQNNILPFFDGYVECATCHDVHNGLSLPALLRKSVTGSELCLHCHQDKG